MEAGEESEQEPWWVKNDFTEFRELNTARRPIEDYAWHFVSIEKNSQAVFCFRTH